MARPAGITHLDVVLTAGCNLRCSYCYQNDKKARRMDWDTLRASADLVLASERDEVSLLFIGGEPLLEFPLIERAVAYIEERRAPPQKIKYQVITNGTLLTDEHVDFFADHDFEVQLSFDGVEPAQDLRGRGTFARLDALLDRLRAEKPVFYSENLSVSVTLVISAVRHLADSIDYFLDKQIGEIAISPSITFEPGWRLESIDELDGQFSRIFTRLVDLYDRTGDVPLVLFRRHRDPSPINPRACRCAESDTAKRQPWTSTARCTAASCSSTPTRSFRPPSCAAGWKPCEWATSPIRNSRTGWPPILRPHGRPASFIRDRRSTLVRAVPRLPLHDDVRDMPGLIGHQPGNTDPHRIPDFLCAYNLVSLKYREKFPRQPDVRDILMGRAKIPSLMQKLEMFVDSSDDETGATRQPGPDVG